MRILMLNYEFPPLGGGASPVTYEIAKGYAHLGHKVDVVTMGYKGLSKYQKSDKINIYRIPCIRWKKEISSPFEHLTFILSAAIFFGKHLTKTRYDINHTQFILPTGVISLWLKKRYGLPYIITSHGSDVPGYNPDRFRLLHNFTKPLLVTICNNALILTTPSSYLAGLIKEKIGKYDIQIIPNGINPDIVTPMKKRNIIVATGRLLPRKGFQYLIQAVSPLNTNYTVHIIGDGPMMNVLRSLAMKSKTKIYFEGWLDNKSPKYNRLLGEASIYCLPSLRENASIALLEAMSAGCAVITTNTTGCPETIGDTGILVKPGKIKDIREKIINLINTPQLQKTMGKKARERVIDKFSWKYINNSYEKLLLTCLNKL